MRTLFFLLLLANLSLFGYIQLDRMSSGEGMRLRQQILPDKIRILTAQQVAALAPDKASALPDICAEWGPFNDTDRARALADLEPLALARLLGTKRVEVPAGFWVSIAPFSSRAAAERRLAELRTAGVQDVSVVDTGNQRFAISLGLYRTEEAANARAADLVARGVPNARAGPRQQPLALASIVVRDPPSQAIARIKELQPAYPGTEVRIGSCEKGS